MYSVDDSVRPLHILLGSSTFKPLVDDDFSKHKMDEIYVRRTFSANFRGLPRLWCWNCPFEPLFVEGGYAQSPTVSLLGCRMFLHAFNKRGEMVVGVGCEFDSADAFFKVGLRMRLINQRESRIMSHCMETVFTPTAPTVSVLTSVPVTHMADPSSGYNLNGESIVVELGAIVHYEPARKNLFREFITRRSRELIGCVGLRNQGATCYLNSLLQQLFHLTCFRRLIYEIRTNPDEVTIVGELQRLFYCLESRATAVDTTGLTGAFGWTSSDAFTEHDVQELLRLLFDHIEAVVPKRLEELFCGTSRRTTKCRSVAYEVSTHEKYYDVQLGLSSNNIYASLEKERQPEAMEGTNQVDAGIHGMQNADRVSVFTHFPPILYFHLRRYKYDKATSSLQKVLTTFCFGDEIDLNGFVEGGPAAGKYIYQLQSVLVHHGSVHSGHYEAFTCTRTDTNTSRWLRFDDEIAVQCTPIDAIDDNFSGVKSTGMRFWTSSTSSAYMLVYVRRDLWSTLMNPDVRAPVNITSQVAVTDRHVPSNERTRQNNSDSLRVYTVRYCLDEDIRRYVAEVSKLDVFDFNLKKSRGEIEVQRSELVTEFHHIMAKLVEHEDQAIRLWWFRRRKNHTYRPDVLLVGSGPTTRLRDIIVPQTHSNNVDVYVEFLAKPKPGIQRIKLTRVEVFLILKWYDMNTTTVEYLGTQLFMFHETIADVAAEAARRKGVPAMNLSAFEEMEPGSVLKMHMKNRILFYKLSCGDIVIVQQKVPLFTRNVEFPTALAYFASLHDQVSLTCMCEDLPKDREAFPLALSRQSTYTQVASMIGEKIGCPTDCVRLWMRSRSGTKEPVTPQEVIRYAAQNQGTHSEVKTASLQTVLQAQAPCLILSFDVLPHSVKATDGMLQSSIIFSKIVPNQGSIEQVVKVFSKPTTSLSDVIKELCRQTNTATSNLLLRFIVQHTTVATFYEPTPSGVTFQQCLDAVFKPDKEHQHELRAEAAPFCLNAKREFIEVGYVNAIMEPYGTPFLIPFRSPSESSFHHVTHQITTRIGPQLFSLKACVMSEGKRCYVDVTTSDQYECVAAEKQIVGFGIQFERKPSTAPVTTATSTRTTTPQTPVDLTPRAQRPSGVLRLGK